MISKTTIFHPIKYAGALLLALALLAGLAQAQTTSFTYQGKLTDGGAAANGLYDLQFKLYDALAGGVLRAACCKAQRWCAMTCQLPMTTCAS